MTAAIQTLWSQLIATSLADAGVTRCVISPGSRSTPLVAALAAEPRLDRVTLIDERAAAFFALGAARATDLPVALVCTSGTAAAHYLPAIVEASLSDVPLLAITADRPPELQGCGASQTIDQIKMYGGFVRGSLDLGVPTASPLALRAVRRKLVQAITLARGPHPGPVHLEVPLRKPLEPAAPTTDAELALAELVRQLSGDAPIAPPRIAPDPGAIAALAAAITRECDGAIITGALPTGFASARDAIHQLAVRAGYPIIAEAGSQLRFAPGPATRIDHFDLIPTRALPSPRLVIQLGAEPVAAAWPAWSAALAAAGAERWILAGPTWRDPDAAAHRVILGDAALAIEALAAELAHRLAPRPAPDAGWQIDRRAQVHVARALEAHPRSEPAVIRAAILAVPGGAAIQIGNSLPIRVIDQVCGSGGPERPVLTQRGAAGIDGLIASAAGATWSGRPVLLVLGDVSFAHDLGGLLAARCARTPLAILVIDNAGGQIFAGLPFAATHPGPAFDRHWTTPPGVDPIAVAGALGLATRRVDSPAATAAAVTAALAQPGATVIHAPVPAAGAREFRRAVLERFEPDPWRKP